MVRGNQNGRKPICIDCLVEQERPYTKKLIHIDQSVCGGVDLYTITPRLSLSSSSRKVDDKITTATSESKEEKKVKKKTKLRLHNLAHYEFGLKNRRSVSSFSPIHTWEDVWKRCDGWCGKLPEKFRGKLQRGIMEWDGNECFAFLEQNDRIFFVSGIWG